MYGKLPMYQNIGGSAYKKDLINITKLSEYLNNPHNSFKSVHIAGTNGKGSTAHMIASISVSYTHLTLPTTPYV